MHIQFFWQLKFSSAMKMLSDRGNPESGEMLASFRPTPSSPRSFKAQFENNPIPNFHFLGS
jgi:hypothetical protein